MSGFFSPQINEVDPTPGALRPLRDLLGAAGYYRLNEGFPTPPNPYAGLGGPMSQLFQVPGSDPTGTRGPFGAAPQGTAAPFTYNQDAAITSGSRTAQSFQPTYRNQTTDSRDTSWDWFGDDGDQGDEGGQGDQVTPDGYDWWGEGDIVGQAQARGANTFLDLPMHQGPFAAPLTSGQLDALSGFGQMFNPTPIVQGQDIQNSIFRQLGGDAIFDPTQGTLQQHVQPYRMPSATDPFLASIFGSTPNVSPVMPAPAPTPTPFTPNPVPAFGGTGGWQPGTGGGGGGGGTTQPPTGGPGDPPRPPPPPIVPPTGPGQGEPPVPGTGPRERPPDQPDLTGGTFVPEQATGDLSTAGSLQDRINAYIAATDPTLLSDAFRQRYVEGVQGTSGWTSFTPDERALFMSGTTFINDQPTATGTYAGPEVSGTTDATLRDTIQAMISQLPPGFTSSPAIERLKRQYEEATGVAYRAMGGPLEQDKVNIVGEQGPEAIVNNQVIPLQQFQPGGAPTMMATTAQAPQRNFVPPTAAGAGGTAFTDSLLPQITQSFSKALEPQRFDMTDLFQTAEDVFNADLNRGVALAKEEASAFGLNPGASDRTNRILRTVGDISNRHRLGLLDRARDSFESAEQRRLGALGLAPSVSSVTDLPFRRRMEALPYQLQQERDAFNRYYQIQSDAADRRAAATAQLPMLYQLPFQIAQDYYQMGEGARSAADSELVRYLTELQRTQGGGLNQLLAILSGTPLNNTTVSPSLFGQLLSAAGTAAGAFV